MPLGSQPRIVERLKSAQGTTASICVMPGAFGISIIQGRLQDMNGVPVMGICETPFSAFLRRTSLDELPQFFKVLQGRMSIVGSRPRAVAHKELYRDLISAYRVRHKVRPGITGWAQINGLRGETGTVQKMKARVGFDLEYLRNWSLGLDLQTIVRTVRVAFVERNAY